MSKRVCLFNYLTLNHLSFTVSIDYKNSNDCNIIAIDLIIVSIHIDFVKSGVFVSSVHKNLGLSTSHYNEKDTTKQQQQQRPLKQEKQQVHSIKGKNDRLEEKKRIEHEQRQQNDFPLLEKNFPPLNQERKEEKASEKKEQEKHSVSKPSVPRSI